MFIEITATKRVLQILIDGMARSQELDDLQNFKRCSAVYRYLSGESCAEIARSIASCEESIRQWVHKFASVGIKGFVPTVRRGRKSKLSKKLKAELFSLVEQGPLSQGFMGNIWNGAMQSQQLLSGLRQGPRRLFLCSENTNPHSYACLKTNLIFWLPIATNCGQCNFLQIGLPSIS